MEREPEAQSESGRGRCVVLCRLLAPAPGSSRLAAEAPPHDLMAALDRKGLTLSVCASPAEALADLVIHERALRSGRAQRPIILLLIEPERSLGVIELLDRVAVYAASAVIWRYSSTQRPQLSAWVPRASGAGQVQTVGAGAASSAPALRLAGMDAEPVEPVSRQDHPARQAVASADTGRPLFRGSGQADPDFGEEEPDSRQPEIVAPGTSQPILTQDELSMLLSDDWESQT